MPTQEERLTALEKTVTILRQETASHIRDVDENLTILVEGIRRTKMGFLSACLQSIDSVESWVAQNSRSSSSLLRAYPETCWGMDVTCRDPPCGGLAATTPSDSLGVSG